MNQIAATPNAATAETVAAPVAAPVATPATIPDATEVTAVTHWTDRLFSFRCKRPAALRFRSGEFVMIGLPGDPDPVTDRSKPVMRAYSIASPAWDDELEFYSIKVADGPLTSRLQHVRPGDLIILRPKPVGTLVHDAILPGKRLWLFATGTGFAPFASLLREPETWERFDRVIVTHTCREVADLAYGRAIVAALPDDPLIGELVGNKLSYYPTTTRQDSVHTGRITDLLRAGTAQRDLGIDAISAATDRAMICGSLDFNIDIKAVLEGFGLGEGANSDPRHYVVEKAFVG
ncbi:ferredoxin--NADP reductase [Paracoccus marinus]|uniref:ferredoxin--NADP reductase n=1 Tax=Paracoccus marinus TaxID=288426 RepID=UPI00103AC2FE|nr:ferredoxin--NADP reductase [Paracoccus marinus]GLS81357.1 ferredoxin--NADP(+) reductase [Paracoccus marinus]